ncbi:hypothetical protein FISHEDRAFT_14679, partial [Fistulina hepatica ATCC 64428]
SPSPPPRTASRDSEGYPSWLPKRPLHPAPASTFHSFEGSRGEGQSSQPPTMTGRKPTPRSVRIMNVPTTFDEKSPSKQDAEHERATRSRVWSRATGAPAAFVTAVDRTLSRRPNPRFHAPGLHLELLRSPSLRVRIYFSIYPLLVFLHIPVQLFFDFNAVYAIFQVAKYPNAGSSGKNWALAMAVYIICWVLWIFGIVLMYELIYSFVRRWRVKRPLIFPIYLSAPAFNLVAMTSYTNFCFLHHVRRNAFLGKDGSIWDGLAETFWFYSQNWPTVTLLLPRAGFCLALLLQFWSTDSVWTGSQRDGTFFRNDGSLTDYARGVLIANATWTGWRLLVLMLSWIGLWVSSGQSCAGLCGPRYRWEEDVTECNEAFYDVDMIPWNWRERTRVRVLEAFEFCLTIKQRWSVIKEPTEDTRLLNPLMPMSPAFEGMDKILAAVGFPSAPTQARRGILSEELFERPPEALSDVIPKVPKRSSKDAGPSAPLKSLPYPFTTKSAQISSDDMPRPSDSLISATSADRIPFPPSPVPTDEHGSGTHEGGPSTHDEHDVTSPSEAEEIEVEADVSGSGGPSSGRESCSMSSLGQPLSSRYPFQFRTPQRGGHSSSSVSPSHTTPSSNVRSNVQSLQSSHFSRATRSTGNRESESDSQSPRSDSDILSPGSFSIPSPPRYPYQGQRGRTRAGTVPEPSASSSPSPVVFPRGAGGGHVRALTVAGEFGALRTAPSSDLGFDISGEFDLNVSDEDEDETRATHMMEQPDPETSFEAAEHDDSVGLLSSASTFSRSPRSSLGAIRHRASSLSQQIMGTHNSGSSHSQSHSSRSRTGSGSGSSRSRAVSMATSVRTRAQSLIQNIGAASHSSVELAQGARTRSRANSSMARLEEDVPYHSDRTDSRSGSSSDARASSNENHTFGHPLPLRTQWQRQDEERVEEVSEPPTPSLLDREEEPPESSRPPTPDVDVAADVDVDSAYSQALDPSRPPTRSGVSVQLAPSASESGADISTAAQSFVTAPASVEDTNESSAGMRTLSSWGEFERAMDTAGGGSWRPA